jgi:hypothetical protein
MTDLRDAAHQALEALESTQLFAAHEHYPRRRVADTLDALRAALEQTEQEPVARFDERYGGPVLLASAPMLRDGQLLYTDPPRREWRSLSEEEILPRYLGRMLYSHAEMLEFSRAIEAALRSKNHE